VHLLLSPSFVLVLLVSCALAPPSNAVGKQASSAARVDSLHRHAVQSLSSGTIERRREAIRDLEQATAIEPRRVDLWVDLAEALQQAGRFDRARAALGRVTRLKPGDCDAWVRLGEAWKHDWLMSLDRESLAAAQRSYASACALDSSRVDTWCALSALALLEGRPRDAFIAALRARALDRNGAAPLLVMGAALFRLGNLDVASRAFEASRDQLPPALQRLYDSREAIGVAAHGEATEDGLADRVSAEASWEAIDPDRTTPENEARLDYLTRLALALFLFQDGTSLVWDKRAEMFVRYGPPTAIQFNPAGAQIGWGANLEFQLGHGPANGYAPGPHPYPYNMQLWQYADLGMEFVLWDRSLSRHYELRPASTAPPSHVRIRIGWSSVRISWRWAMATESSAPCRRDRTRCRFRPRSHDFPPVIRWWWS
jgi:tetratricopeptide (TPR) repeat protein